jgi:hypothetical protein
MIPCIDRVFNNKVSRWRNRCKKQGWIINFIHPKGVRRQKFIYMRLDEGNPEPNLSTLRFGLGPEVLHLWAV